MKKNIYFTVLIMGLVFLINPNLHAQKPYRIGTTSANFLELGFGGAGISMGDSYVSMVNDVSGIYWNPAGLGYLNKNELMVMHQPWIADISSSFVGLGYVDENLGTFGFGLVFVSYGSEDVTSILSQEGTGEKFDGLDLSLSLSYGRKLADWFSFGFSGKYITSRIWHESASAVAFDLGAIVNTSFLSWTGSKDNGMKIGMSISNYGTKMQFDGIDLKRPVDEAPDEGGNFEYVPARYETTGWELPLIYRIGVSSYLLYSENHKVTLSIDALHPNNNSEHLNIGGEYLFTLPGVGRFALRSGYKGLLMVDSEYGWSFGAGFLVNYLGNNNIKIDYAFRDIGLLGNFHAYTVSITF
ncbi:MAG: PorV/PorQ family protein [Ignavibacteriae bacterium]|nr:PorV/PorQ family protein [Ignavibacteriota bacterium]